MSTFLPSQLRISSLMAIGLLTALALLVGCEATTASADSDATDTQTGWPDNAHVVLPRPATVTGNALETFGKYTAVALDENGDPGVAWVWVDENADGKLDDSNVYFSPWDATAKAFAQGILVGNVGAPNSGHQGVVALAYDASAKAWVVLHQTAIDHKGAKSGLQLAVSQDRGATWKSQVVTDGQDPTKATQYDATTWPSVVAAGGKVHLAWHQNWAGTLYATGTVGSDPSTWTRTLAPWLTLETGVLPGPAGVNAHIGLALDSAGLPGLAYWTTTNNEKDLRLTFWRPGQATPQLIAKSLDANATREVYLGFAGTQPRVLFAGLVSPLSGLMSGYWASTSTDGTQWAAPTSLPLESGAAAGLSFFGAFSAKGQGVGAYVSNGGNGSDVCGRLKTSRSSDFGGWDTCGPDTTNALKLKPVSSSLSLVFDSQDHLSIVFTNLDGTGGAPTGVVIWKL